MSWPEAEFEDLYASPSKNGLTRPARVRGAGCKMINMGELFANDRIVNIDMERVPMNERELANMLVEKGDLLFARQSLVLAGAGKCSLVREIEEPTTFESHIIRIRLNRERANPEFYHYYFKSPACRIKSIVTQGVQAGIRGNDLKKLKVHVPPLREQDCIASILSSYDDLIENNRRRIQLLERSARLLYEEWFVQLRFPGYEHVKIINGVPYRWGKKSLGELCKEGRESVLPESLEPDTPYIGLEHMPRRSISLNGWGKAEQVTSSKHRFREGDIIFGKIRPYFHKVGIAFVDGVASSDAIIIRPLDDYLRAFILMTVSSDGFVAVTAQTMKEGSKMPRADWKQMQQYSVSVPPEGLLRAFNSVIESAIKQLKTLSLAIRKIVMARDLLLPRLMNGEFEI
jgi:type I restriction enzyme S subunit